MQTRQIETSKPDGPASIRDADRKNNLEEQLQAQRKKELKQKSVKLSESQLRNEARNRKKKVVEGMSVMFEWGLGEPMPYGARDKPEKEVEGPARRRADERRKLTFKLMNQPHNVTDQLAYTKGNVLQELQDEQRAARINKALKYYKMVSEGRKQAMNAVIEDEKKTEREHIESVSKLTSERKHSRLAAKRESSAQMGSLGRGNVRKRTMAKTTFGAKSLHSDKYNKQRHKTMSRILNVDAGAGRGHKGMVKTTTTTTSTTTATETTTKKKKKRKKRSERSTGDVNDDEEALKEEAKIAKEAKRMRRKKRKEKKERDKAAAAVLSVGALERGDLSDEDNCNTLMDLGMQQRQYQERVEKEKREKEEAQKESLEKEENNKKVASDMLRTSSTVKGKKKHRRVKEGIGKEQSADYPQGREKEAAKVQEAATSGGEEIVSGGGGTIAAKLSRFKLAPLKGILKDSFPVSKKGVSESSSLQDKEPERQDADAEASKDADVEEGEGGGEGTEGGAGEVEQHEIGKEGPKEGVDSGPPVRESLLYTTGLFIYKGGCFLFWLLEKPLLIIPHKHNPYKQWKAKRVAKRLMKEVTGDTGGSQIDNKFKTSPLSFARDWLIQFLKERWARLQIFIFSIGMAVLRVWFKRNRVYTIDDLEGGAYDGDNALVVKCFAQRLRKGQEKLDVNGRTPDGKTPIQCCFEGLLVADERALELSREREKEEAEKIADAIESGEDEVKIKGKMVLSGMMSGIKSVAKMTGVISDPVSRYNKTLSTLLSMGADVHLPQSVDSSPGFYLCHLAAAAGNCKRLAWLLTKGGCKKKKEKEKEKEKKK